MNNNSPLTMMMTSTQLDPDQPTNTNSTSGFDNFLDIFSTDMDFEQAYSMYNTLQQKSAIGSFEELNKVQMLNSQYTTNLPTPPPHQPQQLQQQQNLLHQQQQHYSSISSELPQDEFADSRQQIINGGHQYLQQQQQQPTQQEQLQPTQLTQQTQEEGNDDFDHFFTNTESNALERFLDSLANPQATADPLQFYHNSRSPKNTTTTNNNNNNNSTELGFDFNF